MDSVPTESQNVSGNPENKTKNQCRHRLEGETKEYQDFTLWVGVKWHLRGSAKNRSVFQKWGKI